MGVRSTKRFAAFSLALLLAWACGGEGDSGRPARSSDEAERSEEGHEAHSEDLRVDPELAARGQDLFQSKGCVACHTVGKGKLVGPDLQGVTERREPSWIRHMIMNPDSMLRSDATAKALLGQYFTPMSDMKVKPDEARALIHFLRRETEAAESGSS